MDFDQLKFSLYHDYVQFLDCNYGALITLNREKKLWQSTMAFIRINSDGTLVKHDLNILENEKFIENISGVNRVEDLYGRFVGIDTEVDYSELEKLIFQHKNNIALRSKVLGLIPLAMLYSDDFLPKCGYIRAKSFIRMFNKEYDLSLNIDELEKIMSIDYSKNIDEVSKQYRKIKILKNV